MGKIKKGLEEVIRRIFGVEETVELVVAPEETGADYASNVAMKLAKQARKSPMAIAEEIKAAMDAEEMGVEIMIATPGFLNFRLTDEWFKGQVEKMAWGLTEMIPRELEGETMVVEFSDPNPFKVLHVGHLYTSIVGDSISRLLEAAGAKVVRANFGGDVGLHVAKTIWALLSEMPALSPRLTASGTAVAPSSYVKYDSVRYSPLPCDSSKIKQDSHDEKNVVVDGGLTIEKIAACYVRGTQAYEEDEAAKKEITRLNKVIYALAELGEGRKDERLALEAIAEDYGYATMEVARIADLYWRGRTLSYDYFKDFYAKIGIKFDKFYPESSVVDLGVKEVRGHVGEVYEESEGAIVYRGEKVGLHTRVFINAQGVPTYETKDVGLIFTKWEDWHFDKSVVITGNEQTDYMKVVLASVREYAPELVGRTEHLTHGLVKLQGNVKMSSRKGNFLKAVDVIEMVETSLLESSVSGGEVEPASGRDEDKMKVVLAAIKYAFLKYRMGGDIVFDPKTSVAATGNSGVYLAYAVVRAKKVLTKMAEKRKLGEEVNKKFVQPVENSVENSEKRQKERIFERKLNKKIVQYLEVLEEAVRDLAPYKVCGYLYELAQEFSRFYENVQVVGNEREEELEIVVRAYLGVMEHGMESILGIKLPNEM